MKKILPLMLMLAGCGSNSIAEAEYRTTNPQLRVLKVGSSDGCDIFLFYFGNDGRYFVRCKDADTVTANPINCGKNCVRIEDVQALVEKAKSEK